jgi:hypothetical protein
MRGMEEMRNAYKILVGIHEVNDLLGNLSAHGKIISSWILKK